MQTKEFYSHGKLLLTGEYVVLDAALALGLPTKFGQFLKVKTIDGQEFQWTSYLKNGEVWQHIKFSIKDILKPTSQNNFEKRLFQILNIIYQSKPDLFNQAYIFSTQLEFDKNWGLGSSSTLINNLADWAQIDAYKLLEQTFGGSGYDIAAAKLQTPFLYQKQKDQIFTQNIEISKNLKPHLYFVYLNQKQNSREAIKAYREKSSKHQNSIDKISEISKNITKTSDIDTFEKRITEHEQIISEIIKQKPIQESKFKDYKNGIVKSLGAWGGDFMLVTVKKPTDLEYFKTKGYHIIFNYEQLVF